MKAVEFYSGIGGLHYALNKASQGQAQVVAAFDINDAANDVYQYNFKFRPRQANIEKVSCNELDKYKADIWMLSPPCQPYTRQGHMKDSADNRAGSFLKLIDKIKDLKHPPKGLLVENVVGFESSNTRNELKKVLEQNGYQMLEFILSPIQFGIPYARPRYFCIAFRGNDFDVSTLQQNGPLSVVPGVLVRCDMDIVQAQLEQQKVQVQKVEDFLIKDFEEEQEVPLLPKKPSEQLADCTQQKDKANDEKFTSNLEQDFWEMLRVTQKTIHNCADILNIVTPHSQRTCCFTKKYTQYTKGTGSILATQNFQVLDQLQQKEGLLKRSSQFNNLKASDDVVSNDEESPFDSQIFEYSTSSYQQLGSYYKYTNNNSIIQTKNNIHNNDNQQLNEIDEETRNVENYEQKSIEHNIDNQNFEHNSNEYIIEQKSIEHNINTQNFERNSNEHIIDNQNLHKFDQQTENIIISSQQNDADDDAQKYLSSVQKKVPPRLDKNDGKNYVRDQKIKNKVCLDNIQLYRQFLAGEYELLNLRYFCPREIANFHSFPESFKFPECTSLRQRYQLLGNSLSVDVVADLLKLLMKLM